MGASIESKDNENATALMYAADGHTNAVEVLLHEGAAIYVVDALNRTAIAPIAHAADNGNKNTITTLKLGGCDINCRNQEGRMQLSVAAEMDMGSVVKSLISAGAEIDARDNDDQTPLWWATETPYNTETIQILLENGALRSAKSGSGQTSADIARFKGGKRAYNLLPRVEKNELNGQQATKTRHCFFKN